MQLKKNARYPLSLPAGQGSGQGKAGVGSTLEHSTPREPVALAVFKRGRWCVVAKLTFLDGQPILAIAVRNQKGTAQAISVPLEVIDFGERRNCQYLYWRKDRYPPEMRRVELCRLRRFGRLRGDGEFYLPLSKMAEVTWREWPYALEVVRLGGMPHDRDRNGQSQLPLFGGS